MATPAKGKAKGKGVRRAAPSAVQVVDAPLDELSRDQLSVFLYVALLPEETRAIVKELGLGVPGFRTEALGDVERCDVIADEIRAHPPSAAPVLAALARAFETPPLPRLALGAEEAADLLAVGGGDAALALCVWRVLSDRDATIRAQARPLLDELATHYFGPQDKEKGGAREAADEDPSARLGRLEAALAQAQGRLREAEQKGEARADEARRRGEEQREKLQGALREARARESAATEESARAREEAAEARRDLARLKGEIDLLRASDAVQEAQRARAEARDLAGKAGALESRVERLRERERELLADLERARADRAGAPSEPRAEPSQADDEADLGEVETWLFPVYTREFYDSLDGWDRRVQRAAFKQAHLLASDHRHPSLRALPLEGLPGYYRVRVATDVRLIYRRPERQNVVEILSLIDREDLDRFIRQAKTRG